MAHIPVSGLPVRRLSILIAGLVLGCDEVSFPTPAPEEEFQATLAGANEAPTPVTAPGSGTATFAVTLDTFFAFRIDVAAIDSPTVAHIHEGAAGIPGGIIVTLYTGPTRGLAYAGVLGQNQLRPSTMIELPGLRMKSPRSRRPWAPSSSSNWRSRSAST